MNNVEIIQSILVPTLLFVIAIIFIFKFSTSIDSILKSIGFFLRKIKSVKTEKVNLEVNPTARELQDLNRKIDEFVEQEVPFKDYLSAYNHLEDTINSYLNKCKDEEITNPKLRIVIIAVSMFCSWRFLKERIPSFLEENPGLSVDLKLLWVDPERLDSIKISTSEINWAQTSRDRIEEAKIETEKFLNSHPQCCGRLRLRAWVYHNLPHWHGILVNYKFLYLGRVNWSFPEEGRPKLSCGHNKYRYFDKDSSMGKERIELFTNWYKYYVDFLSRPIYDSASNT